MANDATKTLAASAQFVKHASITINEQAQQIEKFAAEKLAAKNLIKSAVEAVRQADLITDAELEKAAATFEDHARTLHFLTNVALHLSSSATPLGAPTGASVKTASAPAVVIPESDLAMARRLGCEDQLRAAYASQG